MSKKIFLIVSVLMILVASVDVHAKKEDDNDASDGAGSLAELKTAVENHAATITTLQNQVNELVNQLQLVNGDNGRNYKKNRDQDKIIKDSQTRLQVLEDKILILTGQMQELQSQGLLPAKSSQSFKEYKEYSKGLEFMNSREFQKAVKQFQDFQATNPKSSYNDYAQYWVGEAYYMQADYPMAVKEYQKLLSKNAKSEKAPTALYRQGMAFYHLQSFDDAKAFFAKVIRTYPQSIEAIQSSGQIDRINKIEELKKQQELEMKTTQ